MVFSLEVAQASEVCAFIPIISIPIISIPFIHPDCIVLTVLWSPAASHTIFVRNMSPIFRTGQVLKGKVGTYTITKKIQDTVWFAT